MERFTDLDLLLEHIWQQVQQGADDPSHPYHTPVFGTVSPEGPRLRTVILRKVEATARSLLLHSDRRAAKISEIDQNPRVTWLFWNPETNQQLRLGGIASLHFEDELADQVWNDSRPASLKLYVKAIAPGSTVDAPQSGLPDSIQTGELERPDVASGRPHFAVVQTTLYTIDFLHLRKAGNYRACFQWQNDQWTGAWRVP